MPTCLQRERNWFIQQMQNFARIKGIRVTFVSGDVHCAAVGVLKTLKVKNKPEVPPEQDHRYMLNVVTSAIVNTPPSVRSFVFPHVGPNDASFPLAYIDLMV